jgi:hypothetical protein
MPKRFAFPKPSEATKRFAALLEAEMMRWPDVRTGRMFGMVSVYRGSEIFAMLPASRALESPDCIMIKATATPTTATTKWEPIKLHSEADLTNALGLLEEAYARTGT